MPTPETPSVINLMDANPTQLGSLKDAIGQKNGKVQVVVHPYYRRHANGAFQRAYTSPPEYREKRDRFLSSVLSNNVPTVMLEQAVDAEELPLYLPKVGGTAFLVETQYNSPDPMRPHTWEKVVNVLKDQGARHAVVSGLLLNLGHHSLRNSEDELHFPGDTGIKVKDALDVMNGYAEVIAKERGVEVEDLAVYRWLKEGVIPMGCVGVTAIGFLQNGVDVSLSPISAPEWTTGEGAQKLFTPDWYLPLGQKTLAA